MKKSNLKKSIQDGFSELSPELFDSIMETVEKENLMPSKKKSAVQESRADAKNAQGSERKPKQVHPAFQWNFSKYAISACACLLIFCLCLFGIPQKNQSEIYLVLDINPSIQIAMDRSYQVEHLEGLNEDGKDVIKKLKWNKKEAVFDLLDTLLQDVAEESYLQKDSGILVTICPDDQDIFVDLEFKLGKQIDRTLQQMGISGVVTAFQHGSKGNGMEGRRQLENKLLEEYGIDIGQTKQMSVMELIQYCQTHTTLGLTLSSDSGKFLEGLIRNEEETQQEEGQMPQGKASTGQGTEQDLKAQVEPEAMPDTQTNQEGAGQQEEGQGNEQEVIPNPPVEPQENTEPPVQTQPPEQTEPGSNPSQNNNSPAQGGETDASSEEQEKDKEEDKKDKDKKEKDKKDKDKKDKDKKDKEKKDKDKKDKDKKDKDKKDKDKKDKDKDDKNKDSNGKDKKGKDKNKDDKDKEDNGKGDEDNNNNGNGQTDTQTDKEQNDRKPNQNQEDKKESNNGEAQDKQEGGSEEQRKQPGIGKGNSLH